MGIMVSHFSFSALGCSLKRGKITDENFNNRYFITLEISLIHTVDIEDNKYYLNNIMEKVIPKSKAKFLQNFF